MWLLYCEQYVSKVEETLWNITQMQHIAAGPQGTVAFITEVWCQPVLWSEKVEFPATVEKEEFSQHQIHPTPGTNSVASE